MHIFKSKSVVLGRKTSELNFKYEFYRLILIKIRPNLITEHKPVFWKETPRIQLLFFTIHKKKKICCSMPSAVTSMMQWKKVLAKEAAEESSSSHQWQNTGAHSQQGFIKLARGCLWFLAGEECLPLLHRKNCPQYAQVVLVLKKRKRDPMYGTGFQRWARLASLQMACCLLQHWAEGETGCDVDTHSAYGFFLPVSFMTAWFQVLWEPTSTSCHRDALPKRRVAVNYPTVPC